MNETGLYWPNGRSLFRRRVEGGLRIARWTVGAIVLLAAGWAATTYFP